MKTKAASRAKNTNVDGMSKAVQLSIEIGSPAAGAQVAVIPGGTITVSGFASPGQQIAVSLQNSTTGAVANGNCNADPTTGAWSVQLTIPDPSNFPGNSALTVTVNPPNGPSDGRNIQIVAAMPMQQMKRKSKPKVKPR
jgi:hypothetical protein